MATLSPSSIMYGASGKVGGLVFRQAYGKTVVQGYHESRVKRSELQLVFNQKMRLASWHAREALRDPALKAHYEKKKKRLNVTSAYTAACTDFLRYGRIDKVDTSKYDKGIIAVKAFKVDLGFEEVVVRLKTLDGREVVKGNAVDSGQGMWVFRSSVSLPPLEGVVITVAAKDKTGNVTRVVQEFGKEMLFFHDWRGAPHLGCEIIR
jgi:hypothetical protein